MVELIVEFRFIFLLLLMPSQILGEYLTNIGRLYSYDALLKFQILLLLYHPFTFARIRPQIWRK